MFKKLEYYFIKQHLQQTDDVFEHARITMLYRFTVFFFFIFSFTMFIEASLGYKKIVMFHGFVITAIFSFPLIIKKTRNTNLTIDIFFYFGVISSTGSFMIFNPTQLDPIGASWSILFILMSVLLQRGWPRILCSCFLLWLPIFYLMINSKLGGTITWQLVAEKETQSPPLALMTIPVGLGMYAIWLHTSTIQKAKQTIFEQKQVVEEKQKEILDSIHYAKRIQESLLTPSKYIERKLKELKK